MLRVYIAGPYNGPDVTSVLRNMRRGIKTAVKVLKDIGASPFCPWIDYHFSLQEEIPLQKYYDYSMAWLEVSDAVLLIGDWWKSPGTLAEVQRARQLGIPVFEDMKALEDWLRTQERIKVAEKRKV